MAIFSRFLVSDSGAVAVDWVVLSASVVGLGIGTATAVRTGANAAGDDIESSLSAAWVADLRATLPGGFSSFFDTALGMYVYASGDGLAGFAVSDALGSISGDTALVITSGGVRNGGSTFGGAVFGMDQSELVAGETYRVSYWARTDGDPTTVTFSNQSGGGDQSSLSHTQSLTGEWQHYTYEVVLDVEKPVVYIWTGGPNQTVAIDDLQYDRLN